MAFLRGEQEDDSTFENRQGKSSGQLNLKTKTEKGNNDKQDVGTKSWMVTTVVKEVSRWLCKLDNACEQMAFKISHVEVESEGSTPCLVNDVAKDCVKGGTTCLKCLYDMTKSSTERYVDNIEYKSHEERYANNVKYDSNIERYGRNIQYESHEERYVNGVRSKSNMETYYGKNIQYESHEERYADGVRSKSNVEIDGRNIQYESHEERYVNDIKVEVQHRERIWSSHRICGWRNQLEHLWNCCNNSIRRYGVRCASQSTV